MGAGSKANGSENMKPRLAMAVSFVILGALVLASPLKAQRAVAVRSAPAARMVAGFRPRPGPRPGFGSTGRGRRFLPGWDWGWAYLPPPDYYDYGYEPSPPEAPPEAVVSPAPQEPPPRIPESVLLELHGDQWVRVGIYGQSPAPAEAAPPASGQGLGPGTATPVKPLAAEPARELPPAVLVFHDGHEEQVKHYTIAGTTLYAKADYWTTGSWTKRIAIADLDVPSTLKLNHERGVKFSLPSGPDEVVIRP